MGGGEGKDSWTMRERKALIFFLTAWSVVQLTGVIESLRSIKHSLRLSFMLKPGLAAHLLALLSILALKLSFRGNIAVSRFTAPLRSKVSGRFHLHPHPASLGVFGCPR